MNASQEGGQGMGQIQDRCFETEFSGDFVVVLAWPNFVKKVRDVARPAKEWGANPRQMSWDRVRGRFCCCFLSFGFHEEN